MNASHPATPAPSTPPHTAGLPAGAGRLIALLVAAAFVVILNETIMSVALPDLMDEFAVTAATAQWLTTGFMLTMAVVIPLTGFLLTRLNLRTVFAIAMISFSIGTLISALAPVFTLLVAGRVVQAIGTAIMMPLLMTTVMNVVPADRRGRTMGVISIVIAVAPATGPTIGGIILDQLSWRWMFWLVLPVALLALIAGTTLIRNVTEPRPVPLDVPSVVLSALGFSGLIFGLSSIGESASGHTLVAPWIPILLGAVLLALFSWRQRRLKDLALLDLRVLTVRAYALSLGLALTGMVSLFGTIILLPIYMQELLGASTLQSGMALLPGGLTMGVLGWFVGRAYDRIGPRPLVIPGALVVSAALWGMALTLDAGSELWMVTAWHGLLSVGLACMFSPLMTAAMGSLPRRLYSHGSAVFSTLQQVAGAAGTALFITVLTVAAVNAAAAGITDPAAALQSGVHNALLCGAAISLVAVVGVFFVRRTQDPEETSGEDTAGVGHDDDATPAEHFPGEAGPALASTGPLPILDRPQRGSAPDLDR